MFKKKKSPEFHKIAEYIHMHKHKIIRKGSCGILRYSVGKLYMRGVLISPLKDILYSLYIDGNLIELRHKEKEKLWSILNRIYDDKSKQLIQGL